MGLRLLAALVSVALLSCGDTPTSSRQPLEGRFLVRQSLTIVLGINRLFPGQFQLRHLTVGDDPTRFNYRLEGSFTVSDGLRMEAFLMRREDVPDIVEGRPIQKLWQSGVLQTARFELALPISGEYTFVLDNRVGEAEWKSIDSRVVLTWDQF